MAKKESSTKSGNKCRGIVSPLGSLIALALGAEALCRRFVEGSRGVVMLVVVCEVCVCASNINQFQIF